MPPNLIPYTGRERWMDPATTFTRQEIAERTGLSDDVLSFWSKRGLLVPARGGEGKGSHRRYDAAQINIAAILAVYRDHFGAKVAVIKSLSEVMQRAVVTFRNVPLPIGEWVTVASLANKLHEFRNGKPVMIRAHDYGDPGFDSLTDEEKYRKRPATTESEVLATFDTSDAPMGVLIRNAERIGPGHETEALIARGIEGILIDPEYSADEMWLLRQTQAGWEVKYATSEIPFNLEDAEDFGPGAFIPVGSLIRRIWNIPNTRTVRNLRYARKLQGVLDKHGLQAMVSPSENEDYYVVIDAPERIWGVVGPLAKEVIRYFMLRDPEQPDEGAI